MTFSLRHDQWKNDLHNNFSIEYIDSLDNIVDYNKVLHVTRCCPEKKDITDIPKNVYMGKLIKKFVNITEKFKLDYGILSDLYGIILQSEIMNSYDLHPSHLDINDFKKLGEKIARKTQKYDVIVFYGNGPLMNIPYFKMLHFCGKKTYYITSFGVINKYYDKKNQMSLSDWV